MADIQMQNVVADVIADRTYACLPEESQNDKTLQEMFDVLRLLDLLQIKRLDQTRFMAFYKASSRAFQEYTKGGPARDTERSREWFEHISEKWRRLLELMEADPRYQDPG
jgi:hypothetical protein